MFKFYNVKELRPNPHSVQARLPEEYKKYLQALKLPPAPVHYIPEPYKYKIDPMSNERVRVENRDIPIKLPVEADEGIWGGEGVIQGFTKEKKKRRRFPHYWVPQLKKSVIHSEILNSYMEVTVTERTLRLIDQHFGFDHYVLSTPIQDLKSQLALCIRRKMYLTLLDLEKNAEEDEKASEIYEKYKKYMIPIEEAEWFGLTKREAVQKQRILEEENKPVPLKHQLRAQFIETLQNKSEGGEAEESEEESLDEISEERKSWLSKLNPFSSKKQ